MITTKILLDGKYLYKVAPWLTWDEILYGIDNKFISYNNIIDFSLLRLDENSSNDEIELSILSENEYYKIYDILKKLCNNKIDENTIIKLWIYIFINWIYENRANFADPFEVIEEIYADFDYPEDISCIIRYMPLPEGETGGNEYLYRNLQKLICSYKQELEEMHRYEMNYGGVAF